MPKRKSADFEKKKQKVGKKKLKPVVSTSTEFKAKKIQIMEQTIGQDKGQPTSHRNLTADELLTQLNHYSADTRHEALKQLAELLGRHPEVLPSVAPAMVDKVLFMFEDGARRVRSAALALLQVVTANLGEAGSLGAHEKALRLRLQSALSNPERAVRNDALPLLRLLLSHRPGALTPPPPQLLPSLIDMMGTSGPAGERAALSAIETSTATVGAVSALLRAQRAGAADEEGPAPSTSQATAGASASFNQRRLAYAYSGWRGARGGEAEGKAAAAPPLAEAAPSDSGPADSEFGAQLASLPALLARVWVEVGVCGTPSSGAPESGGGLVALECADAVVIACQELLHHTRRGSGLVEAIARPVLRHMAPAFPLGEDAGRASGPRRGADGAAAEASARAKLNASLCELLSRLLAALAAEQAGAAPSAGPALQIDPSLRTRLSHFICAGLGAQDAASGAGSRQQRRHAAASAAASHTPQLLCAARALLASGAASSLAAAGEGGGGEQAEEQAVLGEGLVGAWEEAPLTDPSRPLMLSLLESGPPLRADDGRREPHAAAAAAATAGGGASAGGGRGAVSIARELSAPLRARFLRSLPKLLWLLGPATSPPLSGAILLALLDISRSGAELQTIQPALVPYFASRARPGQPSVLGPYVASEPAVRVAAEQILHRLHPLSEQMVISLATCCHAAAERAPALLQAVERAAARGAVDLSIALSFVASAGLECAPRLLAPGEKDAEDAEAGRARAARAVAWGACVGALSRLARGCQQQAAGALRALRAQLQDEAQAERRRALELLLASTVGAKAEGEAARQR